MNIHWIFIGYPVDTQCISTDTGWIYNGFAVDIRLLPDIQHTIHWISNKSTGYPPKSTTVPTSIAQERVWKSRDPPKFSQNHWMALDIHWIFQWISTAIHWFSPNFGGSPFILTRSCAIEVGTVVDTQWIRVDIHLNRKKLLPYMHRDMTKQRFTREPGFGPLPPPMCYGIHCISTGLTTKSNGFALITTLV